MLVRVAYRGSAVSYRTSGYHFKQGKVEHLDTIVDKILLSEIEGHPDFLVERPVVEAPKQEDPPEPKVEKKEGLEVVEIEDLDKSSKRGKGRK